MLALTGGWKSPMLPVVLLPVLTASLRLGVEAGSAVLEVVRARDLAVAALVLVLPVMHLSWGVGFLVGVPGAEGPRVPDLA